MTLSGIVILCTISFVLGYRNPEICGQVEITRERDLQLIDLAGLWYVHISVDPTNDLPNGPKFFYELDRRSSNLREYIVGSSRKTGKCETLLFNISQLIQNRPCVSSMQLEPEASPALLSVYTFLNARKTQFFIYACVDFDNEMQKCNTAISAALTRDKSLKPGEKEIFQNKMRQFGIDVPPSGFPLQTPTANVCEKPLLRRNQRHHRQRPRKQYRY